ncbi:hypothetical protein DD889_13555, partial [Staphylococcus pseudintermedius]|uniref:hypothetical protein n=1 Tax=Staphylococcus pseudintermedius TaxID=283734 RepID=UPI000D96A8F0
VAPKSFDASELLNSGLIDQFVEDPKKGLAQAINLGFSLLPKEINLINWLGDDDLLTQGSLEKTSKALAANSKASFVYGACD